MENSVWLILKLMILAVYGLKYFDKEASNFQKASAWLEFLIATILVAIVKNK